MFVRGISTRPRASPLRNCSLVSRAPPSECSGFVFGTPRSAPRSRRSRPAFLMPFAGKELSSSRMPLRENAQAMKDGIRSREPTTIATSSRLRRQPKRCRASLGTALQRPRCRGRGRTAAASCANDDLKGGGRRAFLQRNRLYSWCLRRCRLRGDGADSSAGLVRTGGERPPVRRGNDPAALSGACNRRSYRSDIVRERRCGRLRARARGHRMRTQASTASSAASGSS